MQAEAASGSNVPPVARPAHSPRAREATVAIVALAGVVVGLLAEHAAESWLQPAWIPIADLGVGWLMIACGLLAAAARPTQPAGRRLVLAGFAWFVGTFAGAEDPIVQTLGFSFGGYHDLVLVWLVLSFPGRWPADRAAVVSLGAVAVLYGTQSVVRLVLRAPDAFGVSILDPDVAMQIVLRVDVARAASVVVAGVLILLRLSRTHGPDRHHTGPLLAAGAASAIVSGTNARFALVTLGLLPDPGDDITIPLQWVFNIVRIAVPLAILMSVLRLRAARASLAGAVTDMGDSPTTAALRDALATALGDPGLHILTWDPGREAYLERDGHVVTSAELVALEQDPAQAVLRVDSDGGPLAILAISRNLMDDPALVEAGVALTRLVVRNERQSLRIEEQLAEVRASRARIVEAADAERRRIERDLHDGLQQRMVALAMQLRAANGDSADLDAALRGGSVELLEILDDVRELARGIHPAVLTEAGLGAAIRAAADRSPVPAEVELRLAGRGTPAALATVYYVVSEALANVAKHAREATGVWVRADDGDGTLRVVIEDDGPGGADPGGHGLAGLADRIAALDGRFSVEAVDGGGTRIVAEVPVS
jgi:signal transduction histidine kinase